jgi:tetratricopeptide (TPR) repeat protein
MNLSNSPAPPSDIGALKAALAGGHLGVESRILWLCELARQSARTGLAEDGLKHVKEAIELAEAHQHVEEKANGLDAAAMCHYYRGDHLMAIACGIDAYQGYAAFQRYDKMGHVLTSVAASFAEVAAMDLAEAALRGCLNIAIRLNDDFLLARTQNTLGITLGDLHRFDEADVLLCAAMDNLRRLGKAEHVPKIMTNRGNLHKKNAERLMASNDLDGAKQYLRRGIALVQEGYAAAISLGNPFQIAEKAGSLGEYYFLLGEYDAANTHIELALARSRALDHAPIMAESMLYLGLIAQSKGNLADAIHWLRQGLVLSKERELKVLRPRLHDALSSALKKAGQGADADGHRDAAREWRSHVTQTNREVEREARAMWLSHFSQHPLMA